MYILIFDMSCVISYYVDTKSLGELRVAQKHQIPSLVSTFL